MLERLVFYLEGHKILLFGSFSLQPKNERNLNFFDQNHGPTPFWKYRFFANQEQEVQRLLQSWFKTTYIVFYNNISAGHTSLLEIQRLQLAGSSSTVFADNLILDFSRTFLIFKTDVFIVYKDSFLCRRSQDTLFWLFCLKPKNEEISIFDLNFHFSAKIMCYPL